MSENIDNRIVFMKFDNEQFEKGIKSTVGSLGELNQSLKLEGISDGIENIASKLSAVGASVFTVIQEVTKGILGLGSKAIDTVMGPIIQGGKKRALAIEQAKFQFKGLGMDVNATMESALAAVKGTAYGLDEAATAAAMFGASGLRAGEEMTAALRGISGVAAMSGSSYADVADVFTKVAGQGRLMGDDLNRLASRGINAAATLGKAMGKTEAQVREMVSKGQIDFKLFAKVMNDAFGEHATKASETYTGSLSNMRAALARIGATAFTYQFEALRIIFNALTPIIDKVHDALKPLINLFGTELVNSAKELADAIGTVNAQWKNRRSNFFAPGNPEKVITPLVNGFKNIFEMLKKVIPVLRYSYRQVFPQGTIDRVVKITRAFERFTKKLVPSEEGLEKLKKVFMGVFSIFSLFGKVVNFVISVFASFIRTMFGASSTIDSMKSKISDLITNFFDFFTGLNKSVEENNTFVKALAYLERGFAKARIEITKIVDAVKDFIEDLGITKNKFDPVSKALDTFSGRLSAARDSAKGIKGALAGISEGTGSGLSEFFSNLGTAISQAIPKIKNGFKSIGDALAKAFDFVTFENAAKVFFTGLTTFGLVKFFQFVRDIYQMVMTYLSMGPAIVDSIVGVLDGVTGALEAMQTSLKAEAIRNIAIAIGILALSLLVLGLIDPKRLAVAMGALTLLFAQIGAMLWGFDQLSSGMNGIVQAGIALNLLATAILILTFSLKRLGEMDSAVLDQGLASLALLLVMVVGAAKTISGVQGELIQAGIAIILFAVAIRKLTDSVEHLGKIDLDVLNQGLTSVAVLFALLSGLAASVDPNKMANLGINMLLVSFSMVAMAKAVEMLGTMKMSALNAGLASIAVLLVLMAGTLNILPADAPIKAAGLLIIASSLVVLALALKMIASMETEDIDKSIATIAVTLGLLVVMLNAVAQPNILAGAAALAIVSASLILLAIGMGMLGSLSLEQIGKALLAMAGAFLIIGAAAILLTPAILPLMGLGLALLLIGAGFLAAGLGVSFFAAGIGTLALALQSGGGDIVAFIVELSNKLPEIARNIAKGIGAFATEMINQQGAIYDALSMLFGTVLDALISVIPKVFNFLSTVFTQVIEFIVTKIPEIVAAVLRILLGILDAMVEFMPQIVEKAGDLMVAFINGLADYYDKIITAGADFIIKIVEGIGRESERVVDAALETVLEFITGITESIRQNGRKITDAAVELIEEFAYQLGYAAASINFWTVGKSIVEGIIDGINNNTDALPQPIRGFVKKALGTFEQESGINSPAKVFMPIGASWVEGITYGMKKSTSALLASSKNVVTSAYSAMQSAGGGSLDLLSGLEEPTIKPVIDLDNVYKGAKVISALMNDAASIQAAGSVGAQFGKIGSSNATPTNDAGVKNEATFIQNNYSPKALSRLEIYRQTQNQLRLVKGLGGQ